MAHTHILGDLPANVMTSDGSKGFTAPVDGATPTNATHLATKDYVDSHASADASKIQGEDVSATPPQDGDVLVYDSGSGAWVPTANGLSLEGYYPLPSSAEWFAQTDGGIYGPMSVTTAALGYLSALKALGIAGSDVTVAMACAYKVPLNFIPGTALKFRFRYQTKAVAAGTITFDVELYDTTAKGDTDAVTDLLAVASQAISSAESYWKDLEFVLSSSAQVVPGAVLVLVVKVTLNDSTGPSAPAPSVHISQGWAIVGSPGWTVGQHSMVESAYVS